MNVLVIDIGGSHVKLTTTTRSEFCRFDSADDLGPEELVRRVNAEAADWDYDVISVGFPGRVEENTPAAEPGNLGHGWIGFDFARALGKPTRVINDASLQALGAYDEGRMLFLGLGTGLGSVLITERVIVPLELGELSDSSGETLGDRLGRKGLESGGEARWQRSVVEVTSMLRRAFSADYIVLGGGNASLVDRLPDGVRRGGNDDAVTGGDRLWREAVEPHDGTPSAWWRVVR